MAKTDLPWASVHSSPSPASLHCCLATSTGLFHLVQKGLGASFLLESEAVEVRDCRFT